MTNEEALQAIMPQYLEPDTEEVKQYLATRTLSEAKILLQHAAKHCQKHFKATGDMGDYRAYQKLFWLRSTIDFVEEHEGDDVQPISIL